MTLLIFDCDGTLVDSELLHAQVEVDLLQEKFGVNCNVQDFNRRFIGMGTKDQDEILKKEYGYTLSPNYNAELRLRKNEIFGLRVKSMPFAAEMLTELKDVSRCVASNTAVTTLDISLKVAGLYNYFAPNIFSAEMVAQGKPAPDLFLYAAKKMNMRTQDCIVIEDSEHGVKAALAAGMRVLGFAGGSHCYPGYEEKLAGAEAIFSDMRELPKLL